MGLIRFVHLIEHVVSQLGVGHNHGMTKCAANKVVIQSHYITMT